MLSTKYYTSAPIVSDIVPKKVRYSLHIAQRKHLVDKLKLHATVEETLLCALMPNCSKAENVFLNWKT